jgi:site-specific DNA recombinase
VHEDAGLSAKSLKRPGLTAALADLRPGRILLALKLDRITRRVRDLGDITEAIEKAGADWATVQERFDTTTATGRLMLNIIAELAQWEGEIISERTIAALAVLKERGSRLGAPPFGYRVVNTDGQRELIEIPEELETVAMARRLRSEGLAYRQIASRLERAGRKTRHGSTSWPPTTVKRLIQARYVETLQGENNV